MKTINLSLFLILLCLTVSAQNIDLQSGLIGYWPFNGNANDESGLNFNGTVYNAELSTDKYGYKNSCYLFKGINEYIKIQTKLDQLKNYTLSIWIHPFTANNQKILKSNYWELAINSLHKIDFDFYYGQYQCSPEILIEQWNNITLTFDGSNFKFYLNGKMIDSWNGKVGLPTTNNLTISDKKAPFNGKIDDLYIFNRALSDDEVLAIFNKERNSGRVKYYVEQSIEQWLQKGKFESSQEYQLRVSEEQRSKLIQKLAQEAISKLALEQTNLKTATTEYDADNECFKILFSGTSPIFLKVPRVEAESFDKNFESILFENVQFTLSKEDFVILYLEAKNPLNNKTYVYNSQNEVLFSSAKLDINFDPINLNLQTVKENLNANQTSKKIYIGKSDVDIEIPTNTTIKTNTYALIIGNEDYNSFQTGLNTEVNVDYAMNDAKIFKEYCIKTLGIPEKQIKLLINATSGQMNQGIAWLNNLAKVDNGNAELIFYYSGHGLPDEQTKESYLIPVDISGSNVTQAIKLTDVYTKLNEHTAKKVTVFLDACFSGGARNQGLITMKGVKIKPKENIVTGNMVVISSSTGEESSGVYREKQHGFMTYFLLKKLQESKGNISYKELADFIIESVKKETALSGKNQTPQLNYSSNVENSWTNWKIK